MTSTVDASVDASSSSTIDKGAVALALALLALTVVTARLGYRLPNFFAPLCLALVPMAAAWAAARRDARIDPWALTFYVCLVCHGALNLALFAPAASSSSFFLLTLLYAPFVVSIPASPATLDAFYDKSLQFASLVAAIGVLQYLLQFTGPATALFTWSGFVPSSFLNEFNTLNYLWWPSQVLKSNGFFFLESSLFGIFAARYLALAIVVGGRPGATALLGAALVLSYSGTAWATFAVFLVFHFLMVASPRAAVSRLGLLVVLVGALSLVYALREPLGMERYVERVGELTYPNEQSSGGGRFLAPLRGTSEFLQEAGPIQLIFGDGPGAVEDRLVATGAWGNPAPWTKLIIEYGLVGCALFFLLFCRAVCRSTLYLPLAIAVLAEFLIISPSMLVPSSVYVIFIGFCLLTPAGPARSPRIGRFARPAGALTALQSRNPYRSAPQA